MPQNPVALHLPGEFYNVYSEQPFDGRLGIGVAEDDSLKSLIVVDVLSGKKLRRRTQRLEPRRQDADRLWLRKVDRSIH